MLRRRIEEPLPNADSPFLRRPCGQQRRLLPGRSAGALIGACVLALSLCGGLAGCSQGRGDPCQVDRDCDDGLICVRGRAEHGSCEPEGTDEEDAALPMDAAGGGDEDAAALEPDAGEGDAAAPIDGGPDELDGGA